MARTKKKSPRVRRRAGWIAALAAAALIVGCLGWMHLCARTVHVRYADVWLRDLPAAFDGATVLFASDIDACGVNTPAQAARTLHRLKALAPDLVLLGGDYASPSLFERLNGGADESDARSRFFAALAGFQAPLGIYAISGDNDGDPASLATAMSAAGVRLIDGTAVTVERGGAELVLVGVGAQPADVGALAAGIDTGDCAIALLHTPDRLVDVRIAEARGGGAWADLVLAGHTHGGQVDVFGRTALTLTEMERRYLAGWYEDGAQPVLVTTGVGCEAANFRLNTSGEVWLLTLRRSTEVVGTP